MDRWLPWKSMDVLFLRQRNKGGSDVRVNERVQTTRQFQSGKIILTPPGFHQCLKEENLIVC